MPDKIQKGSPPKRAEVTSAFADDSFRNAIAFPYPTAASSADAFANPQEHYLYARAGHPDSDAFAACIAELEQEGDPSRDIAALAVASGIAAFHAIVNVLIPDTEKRKEYIVSSSRIYGGIFNILRNRLPKHRRIFTEFVDEPNDAAAWERAIAACPRKPRFLHLEPVGNPLPEYYDPAVVIAVGKRHKIPVVVDNTLAIVELRPFRLGADIVYYSTSKVPTAGEVLSGVIVGPHAFIAQCVTDVFETGPCLGVRDAAYGLARMRTMQERAARHAANKLRLYELLNDHPLVARVYFSDYGGLLSFGVLGGRITAWEVLDALSAAGIAPIVTHFGEAHTTVVHPASTTHSKMSPQEQERAGIVAGLIRVWVGAEPPDEFSQKLAGMRRVLDAAAAVLHHQCCG